MRHRLIIVLIAALAVSACQKKASGQTVAIVNGEEITSAELNAELSNANVSANDTKQARSAALQRLIDRKLLVQQAKSDGIDKTPDFLNQQRRSTEDLLINMLVSKKLNTSQLPSPDEVNKFEASHPGIFGSRETWTLNQIVYPLPKDAAVQKKLSDAKSLDEIAQVLTAAGVQFTRGTRKLDTAVLPEQVYAQIAKIPAGEPFIAPGPDKAVASVITAREPAPLPTDQARNVALNGMRRDQANQIIEDRVKNLRASAKIEYQPGFGPNAK